MVFQISQTGLKIGVGRFRFQIGKTKIQQGVDGLRRYIRLPKNSLSSQLEKPLRQKIAETLYLEFTKGKIAFDFNEIQINELSITKEAGDQVTFDSITTNKEGWENIHSVVKGFTFKEEKYCFSSPLVDPFSYEIKYFEIDHAGKKTYVAPPKDESPDWNV